MYHVPAGSHPDAPALHVLREILVAAPSGRLQLEFVETGLATEVGPGTSDALRLAEPGVLEVAAQLPTDGDAREILGRMTEMVEGIATAPIEEREVDLARARLLKKMQAEFSDTAKLGPALSEWIALGTGARSSCTGTRSSR
jgi:zinc protease